MSNPLEWSAYGTTTFERTSIKTGPIVAMGVQFALGVLLAMVYLVAVGSRQDQIVLDAIAVSAAVAVVSPVAGLAMFVVIMPMQETQILAPLRVNAVMAAAIAFGCLLRLPIDRLRLKVHPGIVLLLGYVVLSALSIPSVVSGHPPEWTSSAANELLRLSTGVLLFVSTTYLFRLIPYRVILQLALAGTTLTALLAVGDFVGFLPFPGQLRGLLSDFGPLRASGGFSDPNYLGLYMAPAVVFELGVLVVARRRQRLLLLPIVILGLVCVAATFSRGAYLAFVVGTLVLISSRSRAAAFVVAIGFGMLALALYPAFLDARVGAAVSPHQALDLLRSENSRTDLAAAAIAMFATSPIFGIGFGVFHFVSPLFTGDTTSVATYAHNQVVNILAEQGIVGAIVVTGIAVLLVQALAKSRNPLRWAALAMGATYLVLSLFINSTVDFQGSSLIWLVMAASLTPGPEETYPATEA